MPDERPGASRDRAYMRRALALARRGWGQTAPNPLVGAVVVAGDRVVGEGWHARWGEDHAEVAALRRAGDAAGGATVYVTLEPCAHHGKTPPCVDALIAAGVGRLVYAVDEPTSRAGGGAARLASAGIAVDSGVEEEAARELNAPFFHDAAEPGRPFITIKLAISLDAAIADAHGRSKWITGPASRREVHRLRAGSDAVAVGIETARADDPSLTVRGVRAPRRPPVRIVFDRRARLSIESRLARTARETPVLAIVGTAAPAESVEALRRVGVEVAFADDVAAAAMTLREREIRSLLVEGGGHLASAFLSAALFDRLIIFQAPILLGTGAVPAFGGLVPRSIEEAHRLVVLRRRRFGDDQMTVYAPEGSVHRAD
ncbi:MAG TPA: bifunctional diaminohydroxyphosphoribosylaminopyrimidine deaminase/5-amino-6-(5-phosphoribosylamino)uracil reductase RibD [Gemmatimonadaceae bacterium]|nr:bifunctional diaminohydroxyphosphoribosylaminopyrimidine deaminase/5-amino-6-(5-phosphoribosylamino)uracil reductase RibD [Gemmatimonadaceae bacterium]